MTDTLNIVRVSGFHIATLANADETIVGIQFETPTDVAPFVALTPGQIDLLRDRLREHTTAALNVAWDH